MTAENNSSCVPDDYRPRVIVTKIGLDGHDRGSRLVASHLREAGMEVIYTPPWQSINQVVRLAQDEDADVIGISTLATDHLLIPDLIEALSQAQMDHIGVVAGGIIPENDEKDLLECGVDKIFHPGCAMTEISECIHKLAIHARGQIIQSWEGDTDA